VSRPTKSETSPSPDQVAFSVPQFCARNFISRPTFERLRRLGLGPKEMRPTLNIIRITLDAEKEWQQLMQRPRTDLKQQATERAVKAGTAAIKSSKHVSNRSRKQRARGHNSLNERA
jgi:hypothetical protein